jgi:outer membrane protein assembly factor BamE
MIDAFDSDAWNYVYRFKSGRSKDLDLQKGFVIKFEEDKLVSAEGDFELSENFNVPFNSTDSQSVVAEEENKESGQ